MQNNPRSIRIELPAEHYHRVRVAAALQNRSATAFARDLVLNAAVAATQDVRISTPAGEADAEQSKEAL